MRRATKTYEQRPQSLLKVHRLRARNSTRHLPGYNLACKRPATMVRYPTAPSYGQLKLLPWWDPLRGDPCFEKIVNSLAPK
jgi:hypothetical protein